MGRTKSPIATLDINTGSPLVFMTWPKILAWYENEEKNWSFLNKGRNGGYNRSVMNEIYGLVSSGVSLTNTYIEAMKAEPEDIMLTQRTGEIARNHLTEIEERIKQNRYIPSEGLLGQAICEMAKEEPEMAIEVASLTINRNTGQNMPQRAEVLQAAALLTGIERGWDKKTAAQARKIITSLSKDYALKLSFWDNESEKRLETLDAAIEEREAKVQKSTRTLAMILGQHKSNTRNEQQLLRTEIKDKADQVLETTKQELDSFKELYESKISLQEPISYWSTKKTSHQITTIVSGIIFIFMAGGFVLLFKVLIELFGGVHDFLSFWKDATIPTFGAFATGVAISFAFLRIIYRLFTSQLHLWNDSAERVTMIQTYLALAEKGHAKEEFLGALLTRLFSPSADGIVKNDLDAIGTLDFLVNKGMKQ